MPLGRFALQAADLATQLATADYAEIERCCAIDKGRAGPFGKFGKVVEIGGFDRGLGGGFCMRRRSHGKDAPEQPPFAPDQEQIPVRVAPSG